MSSRETTHHVIFHLFCWLLPLLPTAAAVSSRPKPVVMPYSHQYGTGSGSSWFSIPLTVGSTDFNLTISTSLSRTWVPSSSVCAKASNKTACEEPLGGEYGSLPLGDVVDMASELVDHVYNSSVSKALIPATKTDPKTLLGLQGKGVISEDTMTLKSKTGIFSVEKQSLGVFTTEKPNFNGWLSLQQMAFGLYKEGRTPGPNFHLLVGEAAESNDSTVPDIGSFDGGNYVLIFGGYDKAIWDLNMTQQYPLRKTVAGKKPEKGTLAASEEVGYRIEAPLDDIVYRWSDGGDTDNSLLQASTSVIIDTTTPYLWLPQNALDTLITATGAKWNASMDSYVWSRCFSDCSSAEESTTYAFLDFKFPTQTVTINFAQYFKLQSLWYEQLWSENKPVFPIRALADENAPIVLGRAVMAGVHLWVDYAEEYFSLKASNISANPSTEVVGWSKDGHAPITNTTILATPLSDSPSPPSSSSSSSSTSTNPDKRPNKILPFAGASAGVVVVLAVIAFCCWKRRRPKPPRRPITWPPGPSELSNTAAPADQKNPYYPLNEMPGNVFPPHPAVLPPKDVYGGGGAPTYEMHAAQKPVRPYEMHVQQQGYNAGYVGHQGGEPGAPVFYEMPAGSWGKR